MQIKQKAYYDRRARSRKFDVGDKVLLLLPTDSNKLLLQWKSPYEFVEVVNRIDYKIDVNGVVSTYHANMSKQFLERRNELFHCLLSAEDIESVDDDDNEEFPLDDCTFPTAKKPESYRDVSISDTLTSEQRKEVEMLMKQYPDVLSSLPGRTDRIQHDINLLTSELMPNMEEIINRMSGHKYFTKMDLSKRSKPLTAFVTPRGLFQFRTMPFFLVNSGASFCRLMRIILSNLPNVDSFVDDM